ncbi:MAG: hypothetical protein M3395_04025 [Chloroflexota bacterium]|nr:hypothetical protein [Chloroflexota bacterium]MDQ3691988.1 hypothetical protein [Chloroflexota bacterium]
METIQIQLAAMWTALMLTYLLGDVLRIFSGDTTPGEMGGVSSSGSLSTRWPRGSPGTGKRRCRE